jgi:hypothetical protein
MAFRRAATLKIEHRETLKIDTAFSTPPSAPAGIS